MNILIIKLGAMGDVVRTTSILPGLKKKYPKSTIFWLTKKESSDLLKNNEFIKKVYFIGDDSSRGSLRGKPFGLVICLDDDVISMEIASEVISEKIFGSYLERKKPSYSMDSREWFDMSLISRFGKTKADELKKENKSTYQGIICRALGIEKSIPILSLSQKEIDFANNFKAKNSIPEGSLIIGMNTSAGGRWKGKQISASKTIELAEKIKESFNATLLLFGGPDEKGRNQRIKNALDGIIIDAGTENSLLEFASLINLCDILITSDSLALHLGVALEKKIICFFGPTSSAEIDLCGNGVKLLPHEKCGCFYNNACTLEPNCTETIPVEDFIQAIEDMK